MANKKKQPVNSGSKLVKIPAGRGVAIHIGKGQKVKIINTHGNQVVDFWCFTSFDLQRNLHEKSGLMSRFLLYMLYQILLHMIRKLVKNKTF